jgi:putative molybdopterin biosynthesis protein
LKLSIEEAFADVYGKLIVLEDINAPIQIAQHLSPRRCVERGVGRLARRAGGKSPLEPLSGETCAARPGVGPRHRREPVWARISSPHYHAAAMDGFAVRAETTRGATETSPLRLKLGEQAFAVDTGDPLPPATNAVIMIEQTQPVTATDGDAIEILATVPPWRDVRPMGEDMVATELVLPANHRIRPQDIGAIAGCGHTEVSVYRHPRVAIIPTGTELVKPGDPLKPGDIIEYNSLVLGAMAEEAGAS